MFLATPTLFDALEDAVGLGRYALWHGIESLAEGGQVQAVDVTGELWIDVDTPASLREARRHLLQSSGKNGTDGYVAAYLNRRLSVPIAALLVQLSSVVDGCEGEVARLRHQATARGGVDRHHARSLCRRCQGRTKTRPEWRRKIRPSGRPVACLKVAVRVG